MSRNSVLMFCFAIFADAAVLRTIVAACLTVDAGRLRVRLRYQSKPSPVGHYIGDSESCNSLHDWCLERSMPYDHPVSEVGGLSPLAGETFIG